MVISFIHILSIEPGMSDEGLLAALDRVDLAVDHCLKVRAGISTLYFYRSMYAVQLHNCFKVKKQLFASLNIRL